jgi:hypothetical protein
MAPVVLHTHTVLDGGYENPTFCWAQYGVLAYTTICMSMCVGGQYLVVFVDPALWNQFVSFTYEPRAGGWGLGKE